MYKYRIKKEEYSSGIVKFLPQIVNDEGCVTSLANSLYGLNKNGFDYCLTYDESIEVINAYKDYVNYIDDVIIDEKYYELI